MSDTTTTTNRLANEAESACALRSYRAQVAERHSGPISKTARGTEHSPREAWCLRALADKARQPATATNGLGHDSVGQHALRKNIAGKYCPRRRVRRISTAANSRCRAEFETDPGGSKADGSGDGAVTTAATNCLANDTRSERPVRRDIAPADQRQNTSVVGIEQGLFRPAKRLADWPGRTCNIAQRKDRAATATADGLGEKANRGIPAAKRRGTDRRAGFNTGS